MVNTQYPPVCTPEQAAKILQVNKNTMYELCRRKDFPAMRMGRVWRIHTQAMLEWMLTESKVQHEAEEDRILRLYRESS